MIFDAHFENGKWCARVRLHAPTSDWRREFLISENPNNFVELDVDANGDIKIVGICIDADDLMNESSEAFIQFSDLIGTEGLDSLQNIEYGRHDYSFSTATATIDDFQTQNSCITGLFFGYERVN